MKTIAEFAPDHVEAGTGLALQDEAGRYLFFLAGKRHRCPPGELFYAGIGGHRETDEAWVACARREAREEIGTEIDILAAPLTWYIPQQAAPQQLAITDQPRPLAFYEMIHPPHTPRAGQMYRLVVYQARLRGFPNNLPPDEVQGVIALTREQVVRGPDRKPALAELLAEGAAIVAGAEAIEPQTRLYPLGTAVALSHILQQQHK